MRWMIMAVLLAISGSPSWAEGEPESSKEQVMPQPAKKKAKPPRSEKPPTPKRVEGKLLKDCKSGCYGGLLGPRPASAAQEEPKPSPSKDAPQPQPAPMK